MATTPSAFRQKNNNCGRLFASVSPESENGDDIEREFARVRRRRRGGRYYDEAEETYDRERAEAQRRRGDGLYEDQDEYFDVDDDGYYDEDEDDDDDEMEYEDEEEYGMFGDALIPNALLDSIDPDGAAERFPELARDPRFWFDMLLFVIFLDFVSAAGPQDLYSDLIF